MRSVVDNIPEARLIAKTTFFLLFFLNSVALFVGVLLSVIDIEPAGSITIGGSLLFFFGMIIGLSTTLRELLRTFNLVKRSVVYDEENTLVLEDLEPITKDPTNSPSSATPSPAFSRILPSDELDGLVIDQPPKKTRGSKND